MMRERSSRWTSTDKRLALFVHALAATRPKTRTSTEICNERLTRARDFIVHAPAHEIAGPSPITAGEFEDVRSDALTTLRTHCATCGLCARFGLTPP